MRSRAGFEHGHTLHGSYRATCTICFPGIVSRIFETEDDAEDWWYAHEASALHTATIKRRTRRRR